ncbi:hypothetical protein D9M68_606520 [compost metagenome]
MQQRAGAGDPQVGAEALLRLLQLRQGALQVAAPDVAAVDHTQRQHLVSRQAVEQQRQLFRRPHQIDVQAIHRQADGQAKIVFQAAEIAGDQFLQRCMLQQVVSTLEGILPILRQIQAKDRLVDLHPFHALGSQAPEDFAIQRQQAVEQVELVETAHAALGLAQPQVGQRTDHHWLDLVTEGMRLVDLFEQLFPAQLETLVGSEFRDQVVVVGVEPLGQLLREKRLFMGTAAATAGADATGHAEQGVQCRLAAVRAKTLGDHPEGQRVGQYLVVPGEVANRQQLDAGVLLHLPMGSTQFAADGTQACFVQLTVPVGLQGFLQFTVAADARKTQGMGQGHVETLHTYIKMASILDSQAS